MTITNTSTCPDCGGDLKHYDKILRIVRTKAREKHRVILRRLRCVRCHRIHRELPEFIFPYKHYDGRIIQAVLDGRITPETLGYEDYPCEMTMKRWSQK